MAMSRRTVGEVADALRRRLGTGNGLSRHDALELWGELDALAHDRARCPFCGADADIAPDEDGSAYVDVAHAAWCPMADAVGDAHQLTWFEPGDGETTADLVRHLRSRWGRRA